MSVSIDALFDLFCASNSKLCPKVPEKPTSAHEVVTLSVKLGEQNKDIVHVLKIRSGNAQKNSHIN